MRSLRQPPFLRDVPTHATNNADEGILMAEDHFPDPKPDLVAQLRRISEHGNPWVRKKAAEAADEIERLRKLRAECRACRLTDDALGEDTDHAT